MGGWLAFLLALARPEKVSAIIGIAPAPDFTDKIYFDVFNDQERAKLDRTGKAYLASPYGDPYIITKNFIEEARSHFVMDKLGKIKCPLRILQGQQDADVPWQQSLEIAKRWGNSDAKVTLIKDGDHRLSRDEDLARLKQTLEQLLGGMKQGKFLASNPNGPKHDA
jgi:pimeloyl-ACP methyl ester carboxylesterase